MSLLKNINQPSDVKSLSVDQLNILSEEVRERIVSVTRTNGGHLASSLGAVEAIVALANVFDFNRDKVLFDVGHQAYSYKILTGRNARFNTLRQKDGVSGFPLTYESPFDHFSSGHAGDSLAAAFGYCSARDKLGLDYNVIAFIGDGSFVNGENLEALFLSDVKYKKLLIILNDNGMSISENNNAFFKFLDNSFDFVKKDDESTCNGFFNKIGLNYKSCDGHDIAALTRLYREFLDGGTPTLLHIKTKKGKGYEDAELDSEYYHGVTKDFSLVNNSFSNKAGEIVAKSISQNEKIIAIVAGMSYGTGMNVVQEKYPENFYDAGISEDFAVTYAAGLALGGLKPIVCIYSTFLQRSYDQILTNVCLQNLPVVFLIDRAGVVGGDGCTHQGVFDLSYLSHVPNLSVFTPKDCEEFSLLYDYALKLNSPVAIRYPNGVIEEFDRHSEINEEQLWEIEKEGNGKVVIASGARALKIALAATKNTDATVVNARSVKPLDLRVLNACLDRDIITVEDNALIGGFNSLVLQYLASRSYKRNFKSFGIEDEFILHSTAEEQLYSFGIFAENIRKYL